ncbi:MAG: DUF4142 domain-containing protein [Caulobacteraceae bacterium]
MTRSILIAGAAVAALAVSACGRHADQTAATAPAADQTVAPAAPAVMTAADFVTAAAATDMFEITEAKMALKRSANADVKKFANMMIVDHTKSTAALKKAIAASGESLTLPSVLPADMQTRVDDLTKASGADFDKTYIDQQVAAHQTALGALQGYAQTGDVPALKSFASDTVTVVQSHLTEAQRLQGMMK